MPSSLHTSMFPATIHALEKMKLVLKKGEDFCSEREIDPTLLIQYRLSPDMWPLTGQIQTMTESAKSMVGRLTGANVPHTWHPDASKKTFEDLQVLIDETIQYLKSISPSAIDAAGERKITVSVVGREFQISGAEYAGFWFYPNFFFHATTAYAILRHAGVKLGKFDFAGPLT